MGDEIAIKVEHVGKTFKLPHDKNTSIKGALLNFYRRKQSFENQVALKDISFEVKKGEFFGIVGRNGSGKSTLLKLIAGIYAPKTGNIQVNGKLTPFIELGVGFSPELTGKENIFLSGSLMGFSRKEMINMYDDIVAFAELERFMDQKLKNYSSGMQVRLAFSIAIRADNEILILDEVLAVGDAAFQRKCYDHFMSLKKNTRTVVLVTHDMGAVRQYCDRAIMIEKGDIVKSGKPEVIAQAYQKLFNDDAEKSEDQQQNKNIHPLSTRWGEGQILAQRPKVKVTDETIILTTSYEAVQAMPAPIYGFTIYSPSGANILDNNTLRAHKKTEDLKTGDHVEMAWEIPNIFSNGTYSISVACCDQSATRFYDWVNDAENFTIRKENSTTALIDPSIKLANYILSE